MKTMVKLVTALVLVMFLSVSMFGCYGSFALTKKVYDWNGSLGDKYMVQIAFWVLSWIPVYSAATTIDIVLLNLIEFWTGSNPMAMNNGEQIIKYASSGENSYKIIMSKEQIKIEPMTGNDKAIELSFDASTNAWYLESGNVNTKIATVDGNTMNLLYPGGNTLSLSLAN